MDKIKITYDTVYLNFKFFWDKLYKINVLIIKQTVDKKWW